jgi:hypothetical protein
MKKIFILFSLLCCFIPLQAQEIVLDSTFATNGMAIGAFNDIKLFL